MAINAVSSVTMNGVGHLAIDSAADLPDLPDYAKSNNLRLGTDVISVDDGKVYMMKSDYTFHEI